jgi:hypothetical protein
MKTLWGIALAAALLLLGLNLWFGNLNQDEGWYLYAARQVAAGRLPYADFAFTQGPLMPYAYVPALPWVDAWGVAGGRLYTALLGLAAALCTAWLARRLAGDSGRQAALLAFILTAVNVYQWRYWTLVKTYGLCALCLAPAFLLLAARHARRGMAAAVGAGALFAAAAAVRSSAGVLLPLVLAWLWWADGAASGRPARRRTALHVAAGAAAALAVCFAPFLVLAPEGLWFGLVEYHAARAPGGWGAAFAYKAGFVSRLVQAYFPAAVVALAAAAARCGGGGTRLRGADLARGARTLPGLLWMAVAALTLVHGAAPFPYEDYQVFVYPLFAAALAVGVSRLGGRRSGCAASAPAAGTRVAGLCLAVSLLAAFASPINQAWFVAGPDRVWWPLKPRTALQTLRVAADWVRRATGPADLLLTQDTYLAVEAGRRVPDGLEMGPFSYCPEMPAARAARLHVLNADAMQALILSAPAPVAAFSEWAFAIRAPAVEPLSPAQQEALWRLVRDRYALAARLDGFGQGHTVLRLYRRK